MRGEGMSILIKGMEMPESCDTCFLSKWDTCNERFYCMFDDCPLVEVPVPHGRLIDVYALIARMESDAEQMDEPVALMFTYAAIHDVKHSETVIEAEDGDEE